MTLPGALTTAITGELGTQIVGTAPVGGGDISRAVRADLADQREVLIK